VPINSSTGELHALLAYVAASPPYVAYFISTILVVVVILVGFTLAAGGVGSIFGFLTARLISSRLQSLTHTADAWSQGDFSATAHDPSADELGQLAQQLNRMAEQLQRLFQTRQALAMLEERNLLARDLHDSVKQQIFAATMQVGAAQDLMERNPQAAQSSLNEAVRLGRQAQQELTALIRELRPAALQDQDLAAALQRYIDDWSRQTQIQAQFHPQATRPLPFMLEQTFFRVAQEALSNIARHSQASTVTVKLDATAQHATLAITDDGQGFDPATTRHSGVGLASMRERVEALGGSLLVQSAPGDETVVIVRFDGDGFAQHIREDTKYERSAHSSDR
jgi:NarL family two-component system sensor histidine kinase LiaS